MLNLLSKTISIQKSRVPGFWRFMTTNQSIKVNFSEGIKTITLSSPKTRNALSLELETDLVSNLTADWDNKDLRVIVLAAEGPVFCAGHNMKELTIESNNQHVKDIFKLASKLMLSIIECPVPVIAKVNGVAAAAGCQLVAQCDIAVCSEKSEFITPGVNFGIFCSTPGIPVARSLSKKAALHLLLTGNPMKSDEAKQLGLVTKVCAEKNLDNEVDLICKTIIGKSRSIVMHGKRFYYKQIDLPIRQAYDLGEEEMVRGISSQDGQEGIHSFIQKRKPQWTHT